MPLITVGAGVQELEPGTYPVTVTNVVQKTISGVISEYNPTGADQQVFEWSFNVDTDDDEEIEVQGLTSTMTGPKSKLARFLAALLGPDALQPGAEFDLPDLVGKSALAKVGLNKNGYPRVEDLMAKPKAIKKAKPAPVLEEVEEDEEEAPKPPKKAKPISAQASDDETDLPF